MEKKFADSISKEEYHHFISLGEFPITESLPPDSTPLLWISSDSQERLIVITPLDYSYPPCNEVLYCHEHAGILGFL